MPVKKQEGESGMRMSEFDRQILWPLIIIVVGSAIAFIVGLIIIRVKGRCVAFRKSKEDEAQKITAKQLTIGLACAFLPIGGFGVSYIFGCSLTKCFARASAGFLIAVFVLIFGIWWMMKKEKP